MTRLKISPAARTSVVLLLISGLAYLGVDFFYGKVDEAMRRPAGRPVGPAPQGRVVDSAAEMTEPAAGDFSVIVDRNVFGAVVDSSEIQKRREVANAPPPPPPVAAVENPLKLSLLGTVAAGEEQNMRAIVLDEAKKTQNMYQVGDYIETQEAFVVAIERGMVTLERNGRKEQITLKEPESKPGAAAVPVQAPQPWNDVPDSMPEPVPEPEPPPVTEQYNDPGLMQSDPGIPPQRRMPLDMPHSRAGFRGRFNTDPNDPAPIQEEPFNPDIQASQDLFPQLEEPPQEQL